MKLSYIVTTYNRPELLPAAAASIVRERCPASEFIIVDDHSQVPATVPQLARDAFGPHCRLVRNPVNLGVIGARNAGIAAARGDYVMFLDDDDESLSHRTSYLLSQMEGSTFDFVTAHSFLHTPTGDRLVPAARSVTLTPELALLYPAHINAILWRRQTLVAAGGLDPRVPYLGEHVSMVLWLARGRTAWLADSAVARFGYLDAGLTGQVHRRRSMSEELRAMYTIFLREAADPAFRPLCESVLDMLATTGITDFDAYLAQLARLMPPSRYGTL